MHGHAPLQKSLYAVELSDGCIKVGVTYKDAVRIQQIARNVAKRGIKTGRIHICGQLPGYAFPVEREVQSRLRRRCQLVRGREWFYGVRFGEVVTLLKQLTRAQCSPSPSTPEPQATDKAGAA